MALRSRGPALAATVLALAVTGSAGAHAEATPTCGAEQVRVAVGERPAPVANQRLFVISLAARDGVSCVVGGALGDVRFRDAGGEHLDVPVDDAWAVPPFQEVLVEGHRHGVVYVAAPAGGAPVAPIAEIAFDLPAGGRVEAAWPAPTAGPLRFTAIVEPVS
ncbi:hypothetical protein Q5530_03880 [Saccharothrix sp. BKS2]|uniref:hypothetical protein n=1 Tax=Saccharothrix sp. BKS2 TaxID=3064400 RepID=UPI0039E97544